MAMYLRRREFEVKDTGVHATVPNDDRAKLMYYLRCMGSILDLNSVDGFRQLTDYNRYYLTETQELMLARLCLALNPVDLTGKCIFVVDNDDMDRDNKFLELRSNEVQFAVSAQVLVAGRQRRVTEIMLYKRAWIQQNYFEPLKKLNERMEQRIRDRETRRQESSTCTIL